MVSKFTSIFTVLGTVTLVYFFQRLQELQKYIVAKPRVVAFERSSHEVQNITIASQNIWLPEIPLLRNNHAVSQRIKSFAASVSSCDIVLVQELFIFKMGPWQRSENYVQLAELMVEKGFAFHATSEDTIPKYMGQNSGLVIYSKYPILRSRSWIYKDRSLHEKPNNKGYIIAEILVGRTLVYIATTHLDAGEKHVRQKQLEELVRVLGREIVRSPPFVILAGDLNVLRNDGEFENVEKFTKKLDLKEVFTDHLATYKDGSTLDHMFVSRNFAIGHKEIRKFVTKNNEPVSDHYALWANLIFNLQE